MKAYKQLNEIRRFGRPRAEFRAELLARLKTDSAWPRFTSPFASHLFAFRFAAVAVIALVLLGGGGAFVYASPSIDADHPLYAVKRSIESLGYKLQSTPVARARFQKKLVERRLEEVEQSRREAPKMAANQEIVQFVKEIKSLPREERKEAIREIKERVRERKLEVQTELFKESEKEFEPLPAVKLPVVPIVPTDSLPVKEMEEVKVSSTTTLDKAVEVKYPNLSP